MIKATEGVISMEGSTGEIITAFLGICDGFVGYLEDKYKLDKEKAVTGMSMFVDIVKEDYKDPNEKRSLLRILDTLKYLEENERSVKPKAIVIEANSLEDAVKQIGYVLKDITEKEGDE